MDFEPFTIEGLFKVKNFVANDERGVFVKTFNNNLFKKIGFDDTFRESYYSKSVKNVIRGMHFQLPPHDHEKLVYVTEGEILDVIVDLRENSDTYKQYVTVNLTALGDSVFIPKGCAHGFLTLSDTATVVYNVTTVYETKADCGILWNSFGLDWGVTDPIVSKRDQSFEKIENFKTPFLKA